MGLSLTTSILLFFAFAVVIGLAGSRLTRIADRLADQTGWGEAIFGAILMGGITSLPGIITSVTAAWEGYPQMAVSNAIGGIAAQTVFLAFADITYRKVNLEHASASVQNLMEGVLLMILLGLILLFANSPEITFFNIHPGSLLLVLIYILGMRLTSKAGESPMWRPRQTQETVFDVADEANTHPDSRQWVNWLSFVLLGILVGGAGYGVAQTAIVIATQTGLSETVIGSLMTAVVTSLPELITTLSAVRHGALTMAVSGIIGGNTFDILFVAFADWAYVESIFHNISNKEIYLTALTLLLTGVLILGLLARQKQGFGGIGWESFTLLLGFFGGYVLLFLF